MHGVRFGALGALLMVVLTGACVRPKPVRSVPAVVSSRVALPVYRFVSLGVTSPLTQRALDGGRVGVLSEGGLTREIVAPDGSVEQVSARAREMLMGGVPVPARLGGGFVFWDGGALYRARSFSGPLEPVASLQTNVVGVEFGPDFLLLFHSGAPPRAFGLDPARPLPLSPHGVIEVAATDDGRALALDATGRALASTDAGKTWRDVTSAVGAVQGVRNEGPEVAFVVSRSSGAWLQTTGQFERHAFAPPTSSSAEPTPAALLVRAVMDGVPLPDGRVLSPGKQGLLLVDVHSGNAQPTAPAGPAGSNCVPLSLQDEGLGACFNYDSSGTTTTVVSHVLSAAPRSEKTFTGSAVQLLAGRTLNVIASCAGTQGEGVACVRDATGTWTETRVSSELLRHWLPLFWLPREQGGVVVIASERAARAPRLALIDPRTEITTPWDASLEQVNGNDPGGGHRVRFQQFADGSVRGFTQTNSIAADPKGHVSLSGHTFTSVSNAAAYALARDASERLWQTNDWGAEWQEIAPPPFDSMPEGGDARENPRPSGRASSMSCSAVGCALEHSSTVGSWLRLGWPIDPPRTRTTATPHPDQSSATPPAPPPLPPTVLPTLRCVARGKATRSLVSAVKTAPEGARSERKGPRSVSFLEPFEPRARPRQVTLSPARQTQPAGAKRERSERRFAFDDSEAGQRVLLSPAPGHAAGVLLTDRGLSFALSNNGKSQPLPDGCTPASGYLDHPGKLLIACTEWSGATRVEEAPSGLVRWRLPAAAHFRDRSLPGMHFLPPGESVFLNLDAIAVGDDGKAGILRLPPGAEPPTPDNPAWLLGDDFTPRELAPWSTLELASSAACAHAGGYRAIVQTSKSWVDFGDSSTDARTSMTALVRWSAERVCLEAIEEGPLLARFVGAEPGAVSVSVEGAASVRTPAQCELEASR